MPWYRVPPLLCGSIRHGLGKDSTAELDCVLLDYGVLIIEKHYLHLQALKSFLDCMCAQHFTFHSCCFVSVDLRDRSTCLNEVLAGQY